MKVSIYYPKIRGQICGLYLGLGLKADILTFFKKLEHFRYKFQFLQGIVIGYNKARRIKQQLKRNQKHISFQEKLDLFNFLPSRFIDEFGYSEFEKTADSFLNNTDNWVNEEIPNSIQKEIEQLLNQNKTQRAIELIYRFNYDNYRLKLIIEFEHIKELLPQLRTQKRNNTISSEQYKQGRIEIENWLKEWLSKRVEISTEDYISKLTSPNQVEIQEAIDYFRDLFYFDSPISDENYVRVIKILVDKLSNPFNTNDKSDLLGIIENSLYTNDLNSVIGEKAFYEVISYMANSKTPLFRSILTPFSKHEQLKLIISDYFKAGNI